MKLEVYSVTCPECKGMRFIGRNQLCPICDGVGQIIIPDYVDKPGLSAANVRNVLIGCGIALAILVWAVLR